MWIRLLVVCESCIQICDLRFPESIIVSKSAFGRSPTDHIRLRRVDSIAACRGECRVGMVVGFG